MCGPGGEQRAAQCRRDFLTSKVLVTPHPGQQPLQANLGDLQLQGCGRASGTCGWEGRWGRNRVGRAGCLSQLGAHREPELHGQASGNYGWEGQQGTKQGQQDRMSLPVRSPASGPGTPTAGEGSSPRGPHPRRRPSEPTWELISRCVQARLGPSSTGPLQGLWPQYPLQLGPASGLKAVLTACSTTQRKAGSLKRLFHKVMVT